MNADEYLAQVRGQLKGFPMEEQDDILAELASHIEAGAEDAAQGADEAERSRRVLTEMGSPQQMGSGFHSVYRPNRWLDFLLIFVPAYLFIPLINWLYLYIFHRGTATFDENLMVSFSLRAVLLLGLVMVLISVRRRSLLMFAFWAPVVIARLVTLILRNLRWLPGQIAPAEITSVFEFSFYLLLLAGMLVWLGRTVWKNRTNYLIVLFALQPIIGTIFGGFTTYYGLANGLYPAYPNWTLRVSAIQNAVEVGSLAGFMLLRQRDLRWLAFFLGMLNSTVMIAGAYWPSPVLIGLWGLYSLILPCLWALDWNRRRWLYAGPDSPTKA